jgi:hypothetical protein
MKIEWLPLNFHESKNERSAMNQRVKSRIEFIGNRRLEHQLTSW